MTEDEAPEPLPMPEDRCACVGVCHPNADCPDIANVGNIGHGHFCCNRCCWMNDCDKVL